MGLGADLADEFIRPALATLDDLYRLGHAELAASDGQHFQYELNVNPAVSAKQAGKECRGSWPTRC